jgi:hypothetical protein
MGKTSNKFETVLEENQVSYDVISKGEKLNREANFYCIILYLNPSNLSTTMCLCAE